MAEHPQAEPPRYRFVTGKGEEDHANKVNEVNRHGYRAVLMTARDGGQGGSVIVLMEREL